jgi:manganese/zinc/iron transport system permease protein
LKEDTSLGVVFTTLFALGVILITYAARIWHADLDPGCVLYGQLEISALDQISVLGWRVPTSVVEVLLPINVVVLGVVVIFWKELQVVAFDPDWAQALGYASRWVLNGLLGLVALVCVAVFREVGSVLVLALLVVPAATAWLLARRLGMMLLISVAVALAGTVVGCWWAVRYNWNTAGSISAALGVWFALAVLFSPRQGLVLRWIWRWALHWRILCEDVLALLFRVEEAAAQGRLERGFVVRQDVRRLVGFWEFAVLRYLCWRGAISRNDKGEWRLTELGRARARQIVRSHRLWEAWLQRHFQLPLDHLHAVAERMEHFLTPELQAELASELGPVRDPHGREIPPQPSSAPSSAGQGTGGFPPRDPSAEP